MNSFKKYPSYKFILAFLDYSALSIAFFIGLKIRFWPKIDIINNPDYFIHPSYWPLLVYSFFALFIFQYFNLYKKHIFITLAQQQVLIIKSLVVIFLGYVLLSFSFKYPKYLIDSRLVIAYSMISALILVSVFRLFIFRTLFLIFAKNQLIRRRVLIVGGGESGKLVAANIVTDRTYGMELVGFVDDYIPVGTKIFGSYINLGTTKELNEIVRIYRVDEIVVCLSNVTHGRLMDIIGICKATGLPVAVYSELYDIVSQKVEVERFRDFPMIRMGYFTNDWFNITIKRFLDIIFSSIAIIIFSPVMLAIAFAIKKDSPGPVLFKQKRLGRNGKLFTFYKFRSMYVDSDDRIHREYLENLIKNGKKADTGGADGIYKLTDDPRITRVGKFIRKTSLDELPQFFNVLKGDMSIVGPRPALPYEYENYSDWHKERVRVLPGITGLWQVSGRNALNFEDMVVLDLYYIENISPWFDIQIMLKTIPVLILGRRYAF